MTGVQTCALPISEVGLSGDYSYTGEAITPSVRVSLAGQELKEGIDYEVSYRDNVELGTATVTVTGLGRHALVGGGPLRRGGMGRLRSDATA